MHLKRFITLGWFASAIPLASMSAQGSSSTQSTEPVAARWSFSFGVDPSNLDLHTADPGVEARMVANLTRSWQSRNSRWARNISLMVGADVPIKMQPGVIGSFGPQCDCPMRYSRNYAGLTAGVSYDLFHVSRFTPYLATGAGVYHYGYRRSPVRGFLSPEEVAFYDATGGFSYNKFGLGVNGGLGLKMRVGSHQLFIEQMLHEFDLNRRGWAVAPLSLGFRF